MNDGGLSLIGTVMDHPSQCVWSQASRASLPKWALRDVSLGPWKQLGEFTPQKWADEDLVFVFLLVSC